MKIHHRVKSIDTYKGARIAINENLTYSSYMLIKESLRATLAYIAEDMFDWELSNKTNLTYLIGLFNDTDVLSIDDADALEKLLIAEKNGITAIIAMDIDDIKAVKKVVKRLIADYIKEPI